MEDGYSQDCDGEFGDVRGRKGLLFRVGVVLITMSFVVYPLYLVIPALSVTVKIKTYVFALSSACSWFFFGLGTVLAGREWYPYLRKRIKDILKRPR